MSPRFSLALPFALALVLAAPAQTPAPAAAAAATPSAPSPFKTPREKLSYAIGMNIGRGLKGQGIEIDAPLLAAAIDDIFAGTSKLSEKELEETLTAFQGEMQKKMEGKRKELADAGKKEGDAFLVANKTKEGVVTRPSGLQYKMLKEGTGAMPKATDTVKLNYRGTLISGKEFDSSYKRNEPALFPVNRVIPGFTEALQLMKVGGKAQVFIPSELAYKETGQGDIAPNSTLIFEIELLDIQAGTPGAAPAASPAAAASPAKK